MNNRQVKNNFFIEKGIVPGAIYELYPQIKLREKEGCLPHIIKIEDIFDYHFTYLAFDGKTHSLRGSISKADILIGAYKFKRKVLL